MHSIFFFNILNTQLVTQYSRVLGLFTEYSTAARKKGDPQDAPESDRQE
jgi:hypothetical protein